MPWLAPLLDAHLLEEHVHDDEHHDGEKHGVILYLVNFKYDETFVEEVNVHVGVQRRLQLAAPVELFEYGGEVADVEAHFLQRGDLRYALQGELVVGVEGEFPHFQPAFLFLHAVNLPVNLHQHGVLVQLFLELFKDCQGVALFRFGGRVVPYEGDERTALADELQAAGLRGKQQAAAPAWGFGFLCVNLSVDVLHAVRVPLIVVLHLGGDKELLPQALTLVRREFLERVEVRLVVFHESLVDNHVLNLGREAIALVYEEY